MSRFFLVFSLLFLVLLPGCPRSSNQQANSTPPTGGDGGSKDALGGSGGSIHGGGALGGAGGELIVGGMGGTPIGGAGGELNLGGMGGDVMGGAGGELILGGMGGAGGVPSMVNQTPYCGVPPMEPVDCDDVLDENDDLIPVPNPRFGVCCQRESIADSRSPSFRFAQFELTEPPFLGATRSSFRQFIGTRESFNWLLQIDLDNEMMLTGHGIRNSFAPNERVAYSFVTNDAPAEDRNPVEIPISVEETDRGVQITSNPTVVNLRIPVFSEVDAETPSLVLPFYQIEIVRALLTEELSCIGHAQEHFAFNTRYCGRQEDASDGIFEGYFLVRDTLDIEVDLGGGEPTNLCSAFNELRACDTEEAEMDKWLATGVCTEAECHLRAEDEDCTLDGPNFCAYGISAVFAAHAVAIEEPVDEGSGGMGGQGGSGEPNQGAGGSGGIN